MVKDIIENKFGIDRIVPIGQALDISMIWDGYDLTSSLTRAIELNEKLFLDKKDGEYQQNRDPYLMIDCASEVVPENIQMDIKI